MTKRTVLALTIIFKVTANALRKVSQGFDFEQPAPNPSRAVPGPRYFRMNSVLKIRPSSRVKAILGTEGHRLMVTDAVTWPVLSDA